MAKTLNRYPVTFAYGAKDGYYYGPRGIVGPYHRGDDRACPIGTPVVVGNTTIGLTGKSGLASGPHCHIQAVKKNTWTDVNPRPYSFKPGTVVGAGYHSQFGYFVKIRVGSIDVIYAHLSATRVKYGQVVGAAAPKAPAKVYYTARPGDYLHRIAGKFGISLRRLLDLNPIKKRNPDKLNVGERLRVK